MIVASTGRFWVTWVWRADEPAAYSTTSPIPAPTASTATTTAPVAEGEIDPSTSHARTTSSLSPSSVGSLRLATSVPMTLPRTTATYFLPSPARPSGRTASTLACGRGITWTDTTSPTRSAARWPASVAAFTAATSPRTIAVTYPPPVFSKPTSSTLAALTIASAASTMPTNPLTSIIPRASAICLPHYLSTNFSGSLPVTLATAA